MKINWDQGSTKRGAVMLIFGSVATYMSIWGDIERAQSLLAFGAAMSGYLGLTVDDRQ